jgi:YVTN family beta-propeller protein
MGKTLTALAALILVGLAALPAGARDWEKEAEKARGPNLIIMVVTTSTGKTPGGQPYDPVPDVEVELQGTSYKTVTDPMGLCNFKIPKGEYTVVVRKQGLGQAVKQVQVNEGPVPAMVSIVLNPGSTQVTPGGTIIGPGTVYVAFASKGKPGTPSTPGGSLPQGGGYPMQTTQTYRGMIAAGGDVLGMTGPPPVTQPNLNPFEQYQTPINVNPNSLMMLPADNPGRTGYVTLQAQPFWLAFNAGGSRLYVSTAAQTIQVFDVNNGNGLIANIPTEGIVTDLKLTPDGNYILATVLGAAPGVLVIDTANNAPQRRYLTPPLRTGEAGQPMSVAANREGTRIFVATGSAGAGEVVVLDGFTGQPQASIPVGAQPTGLALSPDGRFLYCANSASGDVSVIDAWTVTELGRVRVGVNPQKVAVSPDGSRVFVTCKGSNSVYVLNGQTQTVVATVPVGTAPVGVAVSPDGSKAFVTCTGSGTVAILDGTSGGMLHATTPLPNSTPWGVAVKP